MSRARIPPIVDHEGLTPPQRAFADSYLKHCNVSRAARDAGISGQKAHKLLEDGLVISVMARAFQRFTAESGITVDDVLRHLGWIAKGDLRSIFRPDGTLKPPMEWDDATAACVAKIEVDVTTTTELIDEDDPDGGTRTITVQAMKITRWDPLRALELLGKWLRMFSDAADAPKPPATPLPAPAGITTLDPIEASRDYRKLIEG